jgi:hypothetical protein
MHLFVLNISVDFLACYSSCSIFHGRNLTEGSSHLIQVHDTFVLTIY